MENRTGNKFGYYVLNLPIEEVANRTLSFWEYNRGRIINYFISPNQLYREIIIQRGASLMSWGEQYVMSLGSNPGEMKTYISIEVSLAFGYGLQWNTPKKYLNKWAIEMGTQRMNLVRQIDEEFLNFFNSIQRIETVIPPSTNINQFLCPNCGSQQKSTAKFCTSCGKSLYPE